MAESEESNDLSSLELQNIWSKYCAEQQTEVLEKIIKHIESGCVDFLLPLENIRITENDPILNFLEYIDARSVKSLLIYGIGWGGYLDTEVVKLILRMNRLSKFMNVGYFQMPTQDLVQTLHNCKDTLTELVLEYNDLSTTEDISYVLREIQNLHIIKLKQVKLTHEQIIELTNFLSGYPSISEIYLDAVKCWECNWCGTIIPFDLSKNVNLQKLTLKDMNIKIVGINTSKLETCTFSQLHADGTCQAIYKSLSNAPKLKAYASRSLHDSLDDFCRMIPTLHNLQYFELSWSNLDEFEIVFSKNMMQLRELKFVGINMYASTLYKMIKSLPNVPHPIKVTLDPFWTNPVSADVVLQDIQTDTGLQINPCLKPNGADSYIFYITSKETETSPVKNEQIDKD